MKWSMDQSNHIRELLFKHPAHFLSLGFGSGLAPKAPGTCGSLAAIPLVYLLWALPMLLAFGFVVATFVIGVWCTNRTAKAMNIDDPSAIVWDEITGMLVAALPLNYFGATLFSPIQQFGCIVFIFLFFRLFDIAKPFPVSWADQNLHGGLGIMLDDVFAGVLASLAFILLLFLIT